jgi:hypothetical protein
VDEKWLPGLRAIPEGKTKSVIATAEKYLAEKDKVATSP